MDVVFLGSSHGVTSFLPQELYDQYGITSYNLGCEQQGMVTSYYWLREALRYQSPKAVVLECYFCFPYMVDEPLNTEESYTRKAFDFMRWSPVKAEAVKTICEIDSKQDVWSYYLPNIRYHTRWKNLDKNDYTYEDMASHSELKGFAPLYFYLGAVLQEQFDIESKTDPQWEETKEDYAFLMDQCSLDHTGDIDTYLSALDHDQYTVVFASKDEFTYSLREDTLEIMRRLGLSADLAGQDGCNYLAVVSNGAVLLEELSFEPVEYKGTILDGYVPLYAFSKKDEWGDAVTAVRIGGEEYSKNENGLNIIVYNNQTQKIVDSVWFNTCEPENTMGR